MVQKIILSADERSYFAELSQRRWRDELVKLTAEAEVIVSNPIVAEARAELQKGNFENFRRNLAEIRQQSDALILATRAANNRINKELRKALFEAGIDRRVHTSLVDELVLTRKPSTAISAAMAIENTLMREEVEFVMQQMKLGRDYLATDSPVSSSCNPSIQPRSRNQREKSKYISIRAPQSVATRFDAIMNENNHQAKWDTLTLLMNIYDMTRRAQGEFL